MPLNYTYTNLRDVHTLKNNEAFEVNYTIKKVDCDSSLTIKEGTLIADQTVTLNFVLDGTYSIELYTLIETETVPDILITKSLRDSIVTLAEKILCGCKKCDDCEECVDCDDYLKALVKSIAFNQILYPKYQETIIALMAENTCLFTESVFLCLKQEKVYGNSEIKHSLMQLVAFYYLSFYSVDLEEASEDDKEYITQVYKFNKIAKCIKRLGIDTSSSPLIFNLMFNPIFS